jgi:hypothetical protein
VRDARQIRPPAVVPRGRSTLLRHALCALFACAACKKYDSGLLPPPSDVEAPGVCGDGSVSGEERCDRAIATEEPGACPASCPTLDACEPRALAGSDCQAECVPVRITRAWNGDQCCPDGLGAAEDADCGACGDGVLGPHETCDPPENCTTEDKCTQPPSCIASTFSGDPERCTADCRIGLVTACRDGDGCCPPGCEAGNDDDCSGSCGDGVLEPNAGETCEPSNQSTPCPGDCDDGVACTEDLLTGSPENCNVACVNLTIEYAENDDGCCPSGGHALADSDCDPICGNSITESPEECDGGPQCDESCQRTVHTAITHRYSFDGPASSAVVTDSVGTLAGTARNVTLKGDGTIALAGGSSNQYVELPCATVAGRSSLTIEAWVSWTGGGARQRVFDLGGRDASGNGTSYFLLTPQSSLGYVMACLNFTSTPSDSSNDLNALGTSPLSSAGVQHISATFGAGTLQLYVNGELLGTRTNISENLSDIDLSHCWLGRSLYDAGPEFGGSFLEVRIYDAVLSASEIAISASMGPDP